MTTASDELLDRLMGADVTLLSLKTPFRARAQGNPLFLEELAQEFAETRSLEGQPGKYRVSKPAGPIDIPETIHSVLASRIDLLDRSTKSLLQTSAVVGQDIRRTAFRHARSSLRRAGPRLLTLEAADFLRKVRAPAPEYSFKHELTREVAYGTMLLRLRRSLHAKAVEAVESLCGSTRPTYRSACQHAAFAELWEKAVTYQLRSCRRAVRAAPIRTPSEYSSAASRRFHIGPPRPPKRKLRSIFNSP